jgi:hypothetical protein
VAEPDADAAPEAPEGDVRQVAEPRGNALLAAVLAWLIPGAGHLYLGCKRRGVLFMVLVLTAVAVGIVLEGKLWRIVSGQPLSVLGTFGCAGLGAPYLVMRFVVGYEGNLVAQGYEYGAAFILTGGLMNLLLVLDAWDIARGWKE